MRLSLLALWLLERHFNDVFPLFPVTTIIPRAYTYYLSAFLFFVFGVKMLKEGYDMSVDEGQEEYEEVQADLRKRDEEAEKDPESGFSGGSG